MLTLDPEKRITLDQIIEHPWMKDDPNLHTINIKSSDFVDSPEEYVIQKVSHFGFPVKFINSSIDEYALNHAFACYIALAKDLE